MGGQTVTAKELLFQLRVAQSYFNGRSCTSRIRQLQQQPPQQAQVLVNCVCSPSLLHEIHSGRTGGDDEGQFELRLPQGHIPEHLYIQEQVATDNQILNDVLMQCHSDKSRGSWIWLLVLVPLAGGKRLSVSVSVNAEHCSIPLVAIAMRLEATAAKLYRL